MTGKLNVVTGAGGFLGRHLVAQLKKDGHRVLATSRAGGEGVDAIVDVTRPEDLANLPDDIDTIYHLAAFVPNVETPKAVARCFSVNTLGTLHVLQFATNRGVRRTVIASSMAVYPIATRSPVDERLAGDPPTAYGLSKRMGEELCEHFERQHALSTVSLRFSSIYGQGQRSPSVLRTFVRLAREGKVLQAHEGVVRDFVYVEDAVRALIQAAENAEVRGPVNVGAGPTPVVEAARAVCDAFPGVRMEVQPADPSEFYLDLRRAERLLGYKPRHSVTEGMARYFAGSWG